VNDPVAGQYGRWNSAADAVTHLSRTPRVLMLSGEALEAFALGRKVRRAMRGAK
jgi:hypothetical protein